MAIIVDSTRLSPTLVSVNGASMSRAADEKTWADLLLQLSAAAQGSLGTGRRTNLFEALGVLDSESPHSDYLAWLLDPAGPLDGGGLLERLLAYAGVEPMPDGEPTVEREVWLPTGRLDIRVSYDAFTLIIENKVWSGEGDRQVSRYLHGANIASPEVGKNPLPYTPRRLARERRPR